MEIKGIHHVSAITANAKENYHFYTEILGMRLVKKTVNQDDTSVYHLFYADEVGKPGTDLTFFEIPNAGTTYPGINSISGTSLRVPNDAALTYFQDRFNEYNVDQDEISKQGERKVIHFRDPEGQRLTLISDETNTGVAGGNVWERSSVPVDKGIIGLGPSKLTVQDPTPTITVLTEILTFKQVSSYPSPVSGQEDILIFSTGEGGTGAEIHLEVRNDLPKERPGRGSVHHVALRVANEEELAAWRDRLQEFRFPNSGLVERFYFRSLYFRDPNGILFEFATDGPGFTTDEDMDYLGESLALPPYFEDQREVIETKLKPLDTKKSH
ncbi:glyoxalase family protein [Virgibacillus natechei]|uniref:Glyoxalase family protein n=1 Tax=Virgibacillus natechei TaxID=1216297 RepID=A0ABS4IDZ5_9BACI|nr:ring-cleaving dioxygenase [Virgibacillus natechei]MBP1968556.1 glyoxalase family protein [Virgibacillus natechei]UZD13668.1 ring-cleaving dioxygenase [Virgibacillus natechei]